MDKLLQDSQYEYIFKGNRLVDAKTDTNDILEKMETSENEVQKFTKVRYQQKKGMGMGIYKKKLLAYSQQLHTFQNTYKCPSICFKKMNDSNLMDTIIEMAGNCLNMAMENASAEAADNNKIFVPQNWIKSKASLKDIRGAIRNYLTTLKLMPNGKLILDNLNDKLNMDKEEFEARWTAD